MDKFFILVTERTFNRSYHLVLCGLLSALYHRTCYKKLLWERSNWYIVDIKVCPRYLFFLWLLIAFSEAFLNRCPFPFVCAMSGGWILMSTGNVDPTNDWNSSTLLCLLDVPMFSTWSTTSEIALCRYFIFFSHCLAARMPMLNLEHVSEYNSWLDDGRDVHEPCKTLPSASYITFCVAVFVHLSST